MSVTYQIPRWWHVPLRKLGLIDHWMKFWITVGLWKKCGSPPTKLERLLKVLRPGEQCNCEGCLRWCLQNHCSGECVCQISNCSCAC